MVYLFFEGIPYVQNGMDMHPFPWNASLAFAGIRLLHMMPPSRTARATKSTHTFLIIHISILLVAVGIWVSNANILIDFALTITTWRRARWRRSSRYTLPTRGSIADLFHLASGNAVKGVQRRLAPKQTGPNESGTFVAATAVLRHKRSRRMDQVLIIISTTRGAGRRAITVFFFHAELEALVLDAAGSFGHGRAPIAFITIARV
jgi:hypothetical protein